jgi:NAD-dependent dihydropyrimidine dehydrogenase PreA subunit
MEIPLITKATDPDYHFGAIVSAKNENTCKCKVIIRIPKAHDVKVNPKQENAQGVSKIDSPNSDYTTITSDEEKCSTIYYALMQFDEGDLPGTYSIEIFIDKMFKKRFDFNVVPAPKKN